MICIRRFIDKRKSCGTLRLIVTESIQMWRDDPNIYNFCNMSCYIVDFFAGGRIIGTGVRKIMTCFIKIFIRQSLIVNPQKIRKMYHWTIKENVENILETGIKTGNKKVYITDDPVYLSKAGYLDWKTEKLGKNIDFVLLEIDTCLLSQNHIVIRNCLVQHEFTVDYVPPNCIKITEYNRNEEK